MSITINPNMKKVLATAGNVVVGALCLLTMVQCTNNNNVIDNSDTSRIESLTKELNILSAERDAWRDYAVARGDTIRDLRAQPDLTDSVIALNNSIRQLEASRDSLQNQLDECRGCRKAKARRTKKSTYKKPTVSVCHGATAVVENPTANVNINGCGNTVNINNGVINNCAAPAKTPRNVVISSSASVIMTRTVTEERVKCR